MEWRYLAVHSDRGPECINGRVLELCHEYGCRRDELEIEMWLQLIAVLAYVTGVMFVVAPDTYRSWRLANEGQRTYGAVIALYPDQHRLVRYSFSVRGQRFEGSGNSCLVRNGTVNVWFVKTDPSICACDSRGNWQQGIAFGSILIMSGVPLIWFVVGDHRRRIDRRRRV